MRLRFGIIIIRCTGREHHLALRAPGIPFEGADDRSRQAHGRGKVIGPWNETVTGAVGIFKAIGHMYQAEDKALNYYLEQMTANCD